MIVAQPPDQRSKALILSSIEKLGKYVIPCVWVMLSIVRVEIFSLP
jgi:hypothetical protein